MKKLLILILLNIIVLGCDLQCKTCSYDSQYACTSCYQNPKRNLYVKSCQAIETSGLFLGLGIVIIIVHLIMLILGHGVYRNLYENIQLISLISWGYGSQNGSQQLSALNFGYVINNNFLQSYGPQFFIALTVIGIFIILVSAVDRLPHNSMATLIKRKKIIFPLRLETLMFNITVFAGFSQTLTINDSTSSADIANIIIAIIALLKQGTVLVVVFIITNWSNFQIDNQKFYILIEKLSTCRWYARNNFFFSLLARALAIFFFIVFFEKPHIAGLLVLGIMVLYTLVSAVTMKYLKIRYWIFNFCGNLLTCACLFCIYGCGVSTIGSQKWQNYRKAYYILIITLCSFFLLINLIQMVSNSSQFSKQIKSIYLRFIICQKMDDAVELNKYDSDKYRQKVTSFRKNLIYQKDISVRDDVQPRQID